MGVSTFFVSMRYSLPVNVTVVVTVVGVSQGSLTICFSVQELGLGFVKIIHFQDNSHTFRGLSSAHFSFNGFLIGRTRYNC